MAVNKDKVMANAQKLIQQNKLDKAIKELQKVLEEDPKDVRTLLKIGDLHAKLGNKEDARQSYMLVAAFYSEQGFYLKAVAVYKQILRVDPNLVDVNLKLAELYHQLGLMNDCVAQYQTVANILDRQGKTKDSLGILKKMVDLDTENVASRIKLAELYSGQGMAAEAITEFQEAAAQLKKQDRQDDYIKVAERLLFHDPNRLEMARELAGMYLQRADPKRALGKLQVCFKANPRDVETLTLLAKAFEDQDQLPKTVSVLRELAKIHAEEGNQAQADATWQRVLALAPEDEDAKRALGMAVGNAYEEPQVKHEPSFVGAFPQPSNSMVMPLNPSMMAQAQAGAAGRAGGPGAPTAFHAPVVSQVDQAAPPKKAATGLGALQNTPQTADEQVRKLLAETDVYVKYGLRDKAVDHVKKVFALDPNHLEAHEKLKGLYIKAGNIQAAADEVVACFRIAMGRDDKAKARQYLQNLSSVQPTHAAIATMREELDGVPAAAPMAINVLRRAAPSLPPPEPEMDLVDSTLEVSADDEVAVVVDADDEGVAVELSSGGLEVSQDDLEAALGASAQESPPPPSDLSDDVGDFSGDPVMDLPAEPAGNSSDNEFAEFLRSDAGEAPLPAPEMAVSAEDLPGDDPPADDLLMVPPPADAPPAAFFDEPMVGGGNDLLLDAAALDAAAAGFEDEDYAPKTTALDRATVDAVMAARTLGVMTTLPGEPLPPPDVTLEMAQPSASAGEVSGELAYDPPPEPMPEPMYEPGGESLPDLGAAPPSDWEPQPEPEPEPEPAPQVAPPEAAAPRATPAAPPRAAAPAPAGPDMALDFFPDELAEADFFIQQGLYDEAVDILTPILDEVPDSPKANRMMVVAKALANGEEPPPEVVAAPAEDSAFDLARELDDEFRDSLPAMPSEPTEQVSVESVLAEFKRGVDKVVALDDAATHHDLGIAYKEMGLLDDAIGEFERSSRNAGREADALYMVGICRLEQGNPMEAANAFRNALNAAQIKDMQRVALGYELGAVLEQLGQLPEALDAFRTAEGVDASFKDVGARVGALTAKVGKGKPGGNGSNGAHGGPAKAGDAGKKGKNIGYI